MSNEKQILLLGGTGAMGRYLAPKLAALGHEVLITSRKNHTSADPKIRYIKGNAKQDAFFEELMQKHYDAIVDFMIYNTKSFAARMDTLLSHADHYLFLSSYRVYADAGLTPITEESPCLLETITDQEYLATDEYALTKRRQEKLLHSSGRKNFTIIRPAITYSYGRFQLGNLEADEFLSKALRGESVPFPSEVLNKQTTLTWAGDVATMIAGLVLNEDAFGDTYTAATNEHHSWQEIIEYYRTLVDLHIRPVPTDEFIQYIGRQWQIRYDRMFNRLIDNTKILNACGLRQSDLMPLKEGLTMELSRYLNDPNETAKRMLNAKSEKKKESVLRRLIDCCQRGDLINAVKRRVLKK